MYLNQQNDTQTQSGQLPPSSHPYVNYIIFTIICKQMFFLPYSNRAHDLVILFTEESTSSKLDSDLCYIQ